ncbi:unnamed protein product, partial [Tenebrio molitor]
VFASDSRTRCPKKNCHLFAHKFVYHTDKTLVTDYIGIAVSKRFTLLLVIVVIVILNVIFQK